MALRSPRWGNPASRAVTAAHHPCVPPNDLRMVRHTLTFHVKPYSKVPSSPRAAGYNPHVQSRTLLALALVHVACTQPIEAPGARGNTVPRHIKPDSYERREIPNTPMHSLHVLETKDECGASCDFVQTAESSLTLQLSDGGEARAENTGELVERVTSVAGTSAQQTKWSRTWTGRWSERDNQIEVVLAPEAVGCSRIDEKGQTDTECAKRTELRLRCQLVSVDLVRPRNTAARAWACRARGKRDITSITPLPWVFGVSDPVVVLDGGNTNTPTRRYALKRRRSPQ